MKREFVERYYFFELEERHRLEARASAQVTVVAVLAGGLGYLFRVWNPHGGWLSWVILAIGLACAAALVCAAVCIIRAQVGHKYSALRYLNEIASYERSFMEYADGLEAEIPEPEEVLTGELFRDLTQSTGINTETNLARSNFFYAGNQCIAWAVLAGFVASILIAVDLLCKVKGVCL